MSSPAARSRSSSTSRRRARAISSEVGIAELGGMALYVPAADLQLSRGESSRDTALVLSRFVSAILIRTFAQAEVEEFAEHATVPVINGLTDAAHPLQALADAMTIRERFGSSTACASRTSATGNNVCHSLMRISARFGAHFVVACPRGYEPRAEVVAAARADADERRRLDRDRPRPARGGRRGERPLHRRLGEHGPGRRARAAAARLRAVPARRELLALADPDAVAMHDLPPTSARRSPPDVLYGPRSLVWDQAENRLHTQKAVMALVIR